MLDVLFDPYGHWPEDWRERLNPPLVRSEFEAVLTSRELPGGRGAALASVLLALDITKVADALRRIAAQTQGPFDNRAVVVYCLFRANLDPGFPKDRLVELAELLTVGGALAHDYGAAARILPKICMLPGFDVSELAARVARHGRPYALPAEAVWASTLLDSATRRIHGPILEQVGRTTAVEKLLFDAVAQGALSRQVAADWRARTPPQTPASTEGVVLRVVGQCEDCLGFRVVGVLPDGSGRFTWISAHLSPRSIEEVTLHLRLEPEEARVAITQLEEVGFGVLVSVGAVARTATGLSSNEASTARLLYLLERFAPAADGIGEVLGKVGWIPATPRVHEVRERLDTLIYAKAKLARHLYTILSGTPDADVAVSLRWLVTESDPDPHLLWRVGALPEWSVTYAEIAPALLKAQALGMLDDSVDMLDRLALEDLRMGLVSVARDPEQLLPSATAFWGLAKEHAEVLRRRGWTLNDLLDGIGAPEVAVTWLGQVLGLGPGDPVAQGAQGAVGERRLG